MIILLFFLTHCKFFDKKSLPSVNLLFLLLKTRSILTFQYSIDFRAFDSDAQRLSRYIFLVQQILDIIAPLRRPFYHA
jgi:hypothetical protein